jgi:hypothetical protein
VSSSKHGGKEFPVERIRSTPQPFVFGSLVLGWVSGADCAAGTMKDSPYWLRNQRRASGSVLIRQSHPKDKNKRMGSGEILFPSLLS